MNYNNGNPGPGTYAYDKKQKKKPPTWTIPGTENISMVIKNDNPIVCTYHRHKTPAKIENIHKKSLFISKLK